MHVCFEGRKPRFRSNYRVGAFVPSRIVHFSRHEEEFKKKKKIEGRESWTQTEQKIPVPLLSPRARLLIRGPRQEPLGVATRTERAKRPDTKE
jgi:hypothetical protein